MFELRDRPCYMPPYDSPLEDIFAWSLVKYLDEKARLDTQVEVSTICGQFVIDFVVTTRNGHRIAYECDGKEFHDKFRDEWRDAMILGAGSVDSISRLRGCDLYYHTEDVLYLLSLWDRAVYSERGLGNLRILASDQAKNEMTCDRDDTSAIIYFPQHIVNIQRRNRLPKPGSCEFWRGCFDFASSIGGGNLDQVIARWREYRKSQ